MRVLIVEDDAVSRQLLARTIEQAGHETLEATDGVEAWDVFLTESPDVVVSDWLMPRLDGLELCRRIREAKSGSGYAYVILITSLGDDDRVIEGMQAGADDYLTKPLDVNALRTRLIAADRVTALYKRLLEHERELESLNQLLHAEARRDALTQLGNRLKLAEDLKVLNARATRYGHSYCVALCDIDHFKAYNDSEGHLQGDEVLRRVAETIAVTSRDGDTTYRYGGEEILVILPEQSLETAAIAVERMRREVEALAIPHPGNAASGMVTISAGIAAFDPEDASGDRLLRAADAALYVAKEAGRNRIAASADTVATG